MQTLGLAILKEILKGYQNLARANNRQMLIVKKCV
jgi:hypothetical protein